MKAALEAFASARDLDAALAAYGAAETVLLSLPESDRAAAESEIARVSGYSLMVAGDRPAVVLVPERAEIWYGGQRVVNLGRSKRTWMLTEQVALGAAHDRETLFERVWGRPHDGRASDNALNVSISRIRGRFEHPDLSIETTAEGGYGLTLRSAVVCVGAPSQGPQTKIEDDLVVPEDGATRTNLSPPRDPMFGRAESIDRVVSAQAEGARIIEILGPGGVGKTRVALQAAAAVLAREVPPPGGVWFCDLSGQTDLDGTVRTLASVVGVNLTDSRTTVAALDTLAWGLGVRGETWVVLDNFEQLVETSAEALGSLVLRTPDVRWVVTSRARLGIDGERCIDLGPLPPEDARAMFIERARRVRPGLSARVEPDSPVARIVEFLEGMPLAIELAAAQCVSRVPSQVLTALEDRFAILVAEGVSTDRHRSLEAALAWSWALLSPVEQTVMVCCAAFCGGMDFDDVETVALPDLPDDAPWVLDLLESLCDQSLLYTQIDAGGRQRLGMYESIRAFVVHNVSPDRLESVRATHARCFGEHAQRWWQGTHTRSALDSYAALARELDNLMAAHTWGVRDDPDSAVHIALGLHVLLTLRGPLHLRQRVLDETMECVAGVDAERRARITLARGKSRMDTSDFEGAEADFEAVDTLTADGSFPGIAAEALHARALVAVRRGREQEVTTRDIVVHARRSGDLRLQALAETGLGHLVRPHSMEEALGHVRRAVELAMDVGEPLCLAITSTNCGWVLCHMGQGEEALTQLERGAELFSALGARSGENTALRGLMRVHLDQKDLAAAERVGFRALEVLRGAGHRFYEGLSRIELADVLWARGRDDAAASSYRHAAEMFEELGLNSTQGYALVQLAAVQASAGDNAKSEDTLAESERVLRAVDFPPLHELTLDLYRALVDVAKAGALSAGAGQSDVDKASDELAQTLLSAALDCLSRATSRPMKADPADGDAQPAAQVSCDVRVAARKLRAALTGVGVEVPT